LRPRTTPKIAAFSLEHRGSLSFHGGVKLSTAGTIAALLLVVPSAWAQPAPATPPPGTPPPPKGAAAPAKAPPPKTPPAKGAPAPATPEDEAARLLDEGMKAVKDDKWDLALTLFQRGWVLSKNFMLTANLANAELHAGKFRDAAEHMTFALSEAPPNLGDDDRKSLEDVLAQARAKVGALILDVHTPGAVVTVNGELVGTAPLSGVFFLDPGPAVIEAKLTGYLGAKLSKTAVAGQETPVDITLVRFGAGSVAPPPTGADALFRGVPLIVIISGASASAAFAVLGGAFAIVSDLKASKSHALEQPTATCGSMCASQFDALQKSKVTFAGASLWSFIGSSALLVGTGGYVVYSIVTRPKPAAVKSDMKAALVVRPGELGGTLTLDW
jgi:hypothetical protein